VARRLAEAARGFGAVSVGLAVLGLASFAFLSVSGRALGPAELAPLATLWVLINAIGPALFHPLEQEIGRAVAARAAEGTGARSLFLRAVLLALGLCVALAAVLIAARRPLADAVFDGHEVLVLALALGVAGLAAEHVTRGALAGGGHFERYGAQLALDGVLRIGSAAVLAALGVAVAGPYGIFLGLSPVLAVLFTLGRLRTALTPGPPETWRGLGRAVGWLTLGALAGQFVVNAAPVAASIIAGPTESARAGIFVSVLVLARIPLFLFAAIQASFLPGLASLAARGDHVGFRRRVLQVAGLVSAIGLTGIAVLLAVGPWLVTVVYGADFVTTRATLWPLATAGALFMLASVLAQSLVSLRAYRVSAVGWVVGAVVFLGCVTVPLPLEARVGGAFLLGSLASTVALALALRRRLEPDRFTDPPAVTSPGLTSGGSAPWT
jgi:O-antigen/teichoic acid export membrane protein